MQAQARTQTVHTQSAGLFERTADTLLSFCRKAWKQRLAVRENHREQLRLIGRLAIPHGGTVSLIEFETDRFLVATSNKGQISLLALASSTRQEPGMHVSRARRMTRSTVTS